MKLPRLILVLVCSVGIRAAETSLPFNEEFDDNRHAWPELGEHDQHSARIEGGKLVYENLLPEALKWRLPVLPLKLPPGRDLEVKVRLRLMSGSTVRNYGIVCGEHESNRARSDFVLSDQGYFLAQHLKPGGKDYDLLAPWTATKLLKPGEFNEVVVHRIGGRTLYTINDQPVWAATEAALPGNRFGIIVPGGATVEVDYFRVRVIEEGGAALRAKLETAVEEHRIALGPPRTELIETFDNNARGWRGIVTGETWSGVLVDGLVRCENRSAGPQLLALEHAVNYRADFDLSLRVRMTTTDPKHFVGLSWARSTTGVKSRIFSIAVFGSYQVWGHKEDGNADVTVGWRKTAAIKPTEFNELRVRKLGSTTYVFVNDQVLADLALPVEEGGFVGLHVGGGAKAEIDEFRIRYSQLSTAAREAEVKTLAAALEKAHRTPATGGQYSVLVAQEARIAAEKKANENLPKISNDRLADADFRELQKVRSQFMNKKVGSVWASWKKPRMISDDGYRFYYYYKRIGQTDFFYEFWAGGSGNLVDRVITQVHQVDNPR